MRSRFLLVTILIVGDVMSDPPATWLGTTNGNMNLAGNWLSGSAPASGTQLLFNNSAPVTLAVNQNIANPYTFSVGSLATSPSLSLLAPSTTQSYTISGSPFLVPSGGAWISCGGGPNLPANTFSCAMSIPSGQSLILYGNNGDIFSGNITGNGNLVLGGGSLILSGTNGYLGTTSLQGIVTINTANAICPTTVCTIASTAGTLTLNANQTLTLNQSTTIPSTVNTKGHTLTLVNQQSVTWSGPIDYTIPPPTSGSGSGATFILDTGSSGTLTLGTDSTYSYVNGTISFIGATTVNAGTLQATTSNGFGIQSNITVASGATLNYPAAAYTSSANSITGAGNIGLGSSTGSILRVYTGGTFSGGLTGAAEIIYIGPTAWNLTNVTPTSGFIGNLMITGGGTVALQGLSSSTALTIQTVAGGTLQALAASTISTTTSLNISGVIDTHSHAVLITGEITGAGALGKTGTGTLTLQGPNNYTGGTQVSKGTLVFSNASSFPAGKGPIIINNDAILDMSTSSLNNSTIFYLSGTGTSASLLLGTNNVTLYYGNGPAPAETLYAGTITGSGSLTLSDGTFTTSSTDPFAAFTGSLTLGGAASGTLVTNSLGGITALNFRAAGTSGLEIGADCSFTHPVSLNQPGVATVGSFYINDLVTMTVNGVVSSGDSAAILQKDGPGTLILSGSNTGFNGATSILAGTLQLGSANALVNTSGVSLGATGVLDLNGQSLSLQQLTGLIEGGSSSSVIITSPGTLTITAGLSTNPFYGTVSGNGALILEGTLAVGEPEPKPTFFGTNTYTGHTTLNNGVFFNTEHLGASDQYNFTGTGGTVTILADDVTPVNNFNISSGATATLSTNTYDLTLGGTITTADATATFAKIGQGTLTLTADNSASLTGILSIEGGTLNVTSTSVGSPAQIIFQQFCGTLQAAGSSISLNPASGIVMATTGIIDTQANNVAIPGNIIYQDVAGVAPPIGGGGLSKMGSGILTLSGTNTYNGNTTIYNGVILSSQAAFPATTTATVTTIVKQLIFDVTSPNTGTFRASGAFTTFPKVIFFSSGTIDTNGHAMVIDNIISGGSTDTFTKAGANTLTLSGANVYTGPTVVSVGTLRAGVASVFSSGTQTSGAFGIGSAVSLATGTTLALNGFNNTIGSLTGSGNVTLGSGVLTISNGNGNTLSGTVTGTGGLELSTGALTLTGNNSMLSAKTDSGATLTLNGGTNALGAITTNGTLVPYAQVTGSTYTQSATGTLDTSHFTTFPGTGVIDGTGVASLGGTLILPRIQPASSPQVILQYSSLAGGTTFAHVTNLGSATIDYNATQTLWNFGAATSCQGFWNVAGSGLWATAANWSPSSCAPGIGNTGGVEDDAATFGDEGNISITVTLNAVSTLGAMSLGAGSTKYAIAGSGSLVMGGTGALAPEIQAYSGPHDIQVPISVADTLSIVSGTADALLTISGNITLNSTTLTVTNAFDSPTGVVTFTGTFTAPGGNVILNGGTLDLQGISTAIANLTIQTGTLQMGTPTQPVQITFGGSGAGIWKADEPLTLSSAIVLTDAGTINTNGHAVNSTAIISGSGGLTKIGTATLTLSGANTYTGSTTVTAGTLQAGIASTATAGALGVGSAVSVGGSGTLALNGFNTTVGSLSGSGTITLGSGTLTINAGGGNTFSGAISGSGGITLLSGTQILMASNLYTGTTTVSGGTLQAGTATTAFGTGSPIVLSGSAILDLNGNNETIGSLTSSSTSSQVLLGANTLTIGVSTGQDFQGVISGTGSVRKNGSGVQILGGANTYTGTTTVSVGTLQAGVASVFSGATQISGAFGVGSNTTVSSGATLALDTFSTTIGSLNGAGTVNLGAGSAVLTVTNGGTLTGTITGSGGLTLTSGTLVLSGGNNYTGPTTVSGGILRAGAGTTVFGNGSAITVASGAELDVQSFAVTSVGALVNNGTVLAHNTISLTDYTQSSDGILTLNANGGSAPYGKIAATGALVLDGTLNISGGAVSTVLTILSGTTRTGRFSTPPSGFTLQYSPKSSSPVTVKLVSAGCSGNWTSAVSGNWDVSGNWSGGCVPGITSPSGDTALFETVASSDVAVQLSDGSAAVSPELLDLTFNTSSTSYTVSQFSGTGGTIVLDPGTTGGIPAITVSAGSHTINAPITGTHASTLSIFTGSTLTFGSNMLLDVSNTLTITEVGGNGTLNNGGNISPSAVVIEGGDINNGGIISGSAGNLTVALTANVVNTGLLYSSAAFTVTGGTVTNNNLVLSNSIAISGGTTTNNGDMSTTSIAMSAGSLTNTDLITTEGFTLSGGSLVNSSLITTTSFTETGSPQLTLNLTSPTQFGGITSETATLAGPLTIVALPGFSISAEQTLDLIDATTLLSSQFSEVIMQGFSGAIVPSIEYTANDVLLHLIPAAPSHVNTATTHLTFTSIGQHNTELMRKCLQLRGRFQQPASDELVAQNEPIIHAQERLSEKIVAPKQPKPWSVYAGPIASFGHVKPKETQPGSGYYSVGALVGTDYAVEDKDTSYCYLGVGGAVDYRYKSGVIEDHGGNFTINKIHATIYSTVVPKSLPELAIDMMGGFAYSWDNLHRYTGIGGTETALGTPHERVIDFLFDIEYTLSKSTYSGMPNEFSVVPLVNVQYIYDHINPYQESGAGIYDLKFSKQNPQSLTTLLGSRFVYEKKTSGVQIHGEIDLSWQREYFNPDRAIPYVAFNVSDTLADVMAFGPGRNSCIAEADLVVTFWDVFNVEALCEFKWNNLVTDTFFYLGFGGEF